jgi:glucosamine--fructose-6-phosphate aminotransferase (isomerizing)
MCGIVAYIGEKQAYDIVIKGLKRLEYRGYDSAGVALLNGDMRVYKKKGKVANLEEEAAGQDVSGGMGMGHTRWATHGPPNDVNAHPHRSSSGDLVLIHNGIIENYASLKEELKHRGHTFKSDTDTEIVAQLVDRELLAGREPVAAVAAVLPRLKGAFALAFLFDGKTDLLIGARRGSPLAIGYGKGEMFLGSDAIALGPFTDTTAHEVGARIRSRGY